MLLVMDVGNTNIVIGLFEGEALLQDWRLETRVGRTADEYRIQVRELLAGQGVDPTRLSGAVLSSVVPPLSPILERLLGEMCGAAPVVVGPGAKTGISILYDNPREVGADRIVNAVAAYERYHGGAIIVDLGTATTFDVLSPRGEYLGGAIAPGITISLDALFHRAAKLPNVEIARPPRVVGRNTIASMQSGIYYGYVCLVDGMIERIRSELDFPVRVLATGGLCPLIYEASTAIDEIDELLTLKGLRIIFERNAK